MKKINIVIIGAGEIGQAISKVLQPKGFNINLWDKDPAKIPGQKNLEETVPGAHFLFLCVPSWALRAASVSLVKLLSPKTIVIALSKGIEESTLKTPDLVLEEILPVGQNFAMLGGAMLAEELLLGQSGMGIIGAKKKSVYAKIAKLFAETNLHLEFSSDRHGVSVASILKNIYAMLLGIADGLNWSGNAKGWLVSKSLQEMLILAKELGVKKETILGTAGLCDFVATGFSQYSRNRQVGTEIVEKGVCVVKGEGIVSLPSLVKLIKTDLQSLPLLSILQNIILEKRNACEEFKKLVVK